MRALAVVKRQSAFFERPAAETAGVVTGLARGVREPEGGSAAVAERLKMVALQPSPLGLGDGARFDAGLHDASPSSASASLPQQLQLGRAARANSSIFGSAGK